MSRITIEHNVAGIEGLCVIAPKRFGDSRGWFMESYNKRDLLAEGINYDFVQDNHSLSAKGVLRGMHYQINHPQTKLIRAIRGEVFDAVVDLRKGSPTYGKWHGELLSAENGRQLLIPRGFAHGFLTLSDSAEFFYKCDDFYYPDDEGGFIWNDLSVGIKWPGIIEKNGDYYLEDGTKIIISDKDRNLPRLQI